MLEKCDCVARLRHVPSATGWPMHFAKCTPEWLERHLATPNLPPPQPDNP